MCFWVCCSTRLRIRHYTQLYQNINNVCLLPRKNINQLCYHSVRTKCKRCHSLSIWLIDSKFKQLNPESSFNNYHINPAKEGQHMQPCVLKRTPSSAKSLLRSALYACWSSPPSFSDSRISWRVSPFSFASIASTVSKLSCEIRIDID